MKDGLRLIRTEYKFEGVQDHVFVHEEEVALFVSDDNETARVKLAKFLLEYPAVKVYRGLDDLFYPQFRVEGVVVR